MAHRVWEEVWHQGDLSRIDELFASDFVRHDPGGRELHGTDQNRQFISSMRAAFPDVRYTVDDQIVEGDKVVMRYRFEGTHLGEFQGMPPTRKQVNYTGILIYRITDGKIAEQWTELDLLGLLRQLGVVGPS
ncbi:MAG TPA: ester cyclase [Ktedonobacteraceae bacterium]|nr:ester cyclase [Ktedonobacteraceae bacterium]